MKKIFISLFVLCAMFFVTTSVNADEISVNLPKVKITSNGSVNDHFYVTLERLDETSPMPDNSASSTISVNPKTGGSFKPIIFNKRGTYKYKIYQSYMSNSKIKYDKSIYTLTISVINKNNMTFDLKAVTVLEKTGTDIKQDEVIFNNNYNIEKNKNKDKRKTRIKIVNPYTGDDITKYFIISFIAVILLVILMIYVRNNKEDD